MFSGCVHRPSYAPWPTAKTPADVPTEGQKQGKVLRVRFVQDSPDDQSELDAIAVQLDRPVDPLTVSKHRFRLVGADRRVLAIERVHLGAAGAQQIMLRGHFGDRQDRWASSLALFDGLYAADGRMIAGARTFVVEPPSKRALTKGPAKKGAR